MKLSGKTDIGLVRASNQDACFFEQLSDRAALAVVCDGMGGANAGNVASGQAVQAISAYVLRSYHTGMDPGALAKLLTSAVRSANIELYDLALNHREYSGMGTTVVAAIVQDGPAVYAHVGDSRVYLAGSQLTQLTRDHSVVQSLVESGRLTPEEARIHPRKNVITRALGTEEDVLPDCGECPLAPGETLLLCSDGLTNFADPDEILRVFATHPIEDVADALIALANANGGGDNITVCTVTV